MSDSKDIRELLDKERISYQMLEHPQAFTAMEIAEAQHIPGQEVLKTVIVKIDDHFAMCVLPATHQVDFNKLKKVLKAQDVQLAPESQVAHLFPDCEVGAMPPFGHMAKLKVYLDKILEENDSVAFNAGTHSQMIKIRFKDYLKLAKPVFLDFGVHI